METWTVKQVALCLYRCPQIVCMAWLYHMKLNNAGKIKIKKLLSYVNSFSMLVAMVFPKLTYSPMMTIANIADLSYTAWRICLQVNIQSADFNEFMLHY